MKKVYLLLIGLLLAVTALSTTTYAYTASQWTLSADGYYYFNNVNLNTSDNQSKTYIMTGQNNQFIEYQKAGESDWTRYAKNVKIILETLPDSTGNRRWDIYAYYLDSDNTEISTAQYLTYAQSSGSNTLNNFIKFRFKHIEIEIPTNPNEFDTVADLPLTSGNIYKADGDVGYVSLVLNDHQLDLAIVYNSQDYYLRYNLAANTDLTPFSFENAFYWSDGNAKFITFNHHATQSLFDGTASGWVSYTTWNLSTNEIKTHHKVDVYLHMNYTKQGGGHHLLTGYFYLDSFIIDNLLSVDVKYKWRYIYYPFSSKGDWRHVSKTLQSDTKLVDNPSWFTKVFYFGASNPNQSVYELEEIKKIEVATMDQTLKNTLDSNYSKLNANFNGVKNSMSIYELNLQLTQHGGASRVEVFNDLANPNNTDNFSVISFTYEKDGKINTIHAENINLYYSAGNTQHVNQLPFLERLWQFIMDQLLFIFVVAWVWFGFKNKLFRDIKTALIYSAAGIGILMLFGIIDVGISILSIILRL